MCERTRERYGRDSKPLAEEGGVPMAVGLSTVRLFPLKRVGRKEVPEARSVWEVLSLEVKNPEAVPQKADGGVSEQAREQ